jgi:hypothetical protein
MSTENKPDLACVPYKRKGLYFALTVPILVLIILVFIYLWNISLWLSFGLLGCYLLACFFQAYCCAYQECPYIGGFCPSISGVFPANIIAKYLIGSKRFVKSKRRFKVYETIAVFWWFGIAVFPLYWLWQQLGPLYAIGYFGIHIVYFLIFSLTICPKCASRDSCPGGKLHKVILK